MRNAALELWIVDCNLIFFPIRFYLFLFVESFFETEAEITFLNQILILFKSFKLVSISCGEALSSFSSSFLRLVHAHLKMITDFVF